VLAGGLVEDFDVLEVGMRAEADVGGQRPRRGCPAQGESRLVFTAGAATHHARSCVLGSETSGNETTTAGSWTSL
jgi:hypothetical protein